MYNMKMVRKGNKMEQNERRLPIIESRKMRRSCPECGSRDVKHHKREGEIVCENCGFVILAKTYGQLGKGTRKGSGGVYKRRP